MLRTFFHTNLPLGYLFSNFLSLFYLSIYLNLFELFLSVLFIRKLGNKNTFFCDIVNNISFFFFGCVFSILSFNAGIAVRCIFFHTYTYTPVYTKNFQKLHLHNTLCKIKVGVLKKTLCGVWKIKIV
jgi:hypothetical protein